MRSPHPARGTVRLRAKRDLLELAARDYASSPARESRGLPPAVSRLVKAALEFDEAASDVEEARQAS